MISLSQLWLGLFFFTLQCLSFSSPVLRFLFFFCLVKLLFPDSYWAGRTGKALSLKHSASWGWAHHARTTACSVTTALFQEQAPSLQEGPERHRLLASSAPLRVQKQGAVWEWFEKSETNTSTCCAVLALLGPKSSHSPTFLSSDCPGRALAHGCIRHFGKVTQPRPFPLGSCLRWCYTSAASTGKCALIAGPSPTLSVPSSRLQLERHKRPTRAPPGSQPTPTCFNLRTMPPEPPRWQHMHSAVFKGTGNLKRLPPFIWGLPKAE